MLQVGMIDHPCGLKTPGVLTFSVFRPGCRPFLPEAAAAVVAAGSQRVLRLLWLWWSRPMGSLDEFTTRFRTYFGGDWDVHCTGF